jgi:TPR repeat protein
MNWEYARHAVPVLLLLTLVGLLLWSLVFGVYLNRIGSHGWASTRRLLRTYPAATALALVLCGLFWEGSLGPQWILAHGGRSSAQIAMAGRYLTGDRLLARNPARARSWITRAARSGSGEARLILASMDLEGRGQDRPDALAALSWARLAAGQGLLDAKLLAGEILLNHPELAKPGEQAQAYFDSALPAIRAQAQAGDPKAMFSLGMLKVRAQGLPLDQEGGYALLLEAQAKGIDLRQAFQISLVHASLPPEVIRRAEAAMSRGGAPGAGR